MEFKKAPKSLQHYATVQSPDVFIVAIKLQVYLIIAKQLLHQQHYTFNLQWVQYLECNRVQPEDIDVKIAKRTRTFMCLLMLW